MVEGQVWKLQDNFGDDVSIELLKFIPDIIHVNFYQDLAPGVPPAEMTMSFNVETTEKLIKHLQEAIKYSKEVTNG